jgi:DNA primase
VGLKATATGGQRVEWKDVRDRVNLQNVAVQLMGSAPGRRGERGQKLWWHCPLGNHEDKNPSFAIVPGDSFWKCWGCGEHGDAASLVMKVRGLTFPEAKRWLAEQVGIVLPTTHCSKPLNHSKPPSVSPVAVPVATPEEPPARSSGLPLADALALVEDSEKRLWTPEGADALTYLHDRGLTADTIRQGRLGWVPKVMLPTSDNARYWKASGITIPWFDHGRLTLVKIRQPEGSKPKYAEAFRDRPELFPSMATIRPSLPLIITEGEFDALLLAQELTGLASVVTLGSASSKPEGSTYLAMLASPQWFTAHDADDAGDQAAAEWPARARRARPPAPSKDWTDVHKGGFNRIRYLWPGILCDYNWPVFTAEKGTP